MSYPPKVEDQEWNEIESGLKSSDVESLASCIPRPLVEAAIKSSTHHPLARLFLEPGTQSAKLTACALMRVSEWLESSRGKPYRQWFNSKIKLLCGDDAAATLAEMRALGALLPTPDTIGDGLNIRPYSAKGKSPDFCIEHDSETIFVEVCCARMNDLERLRQEELDKLEESMSAQARDAVIDALSAEPGSIASVTANAEWDSTSENPRHQRHQVSATAVRRPDGRPVVITTSTRAVRPHGAPKPEGDAHTVASRLAGKKIPGQVPEGKAGILWMDLCDPDWAMSVNNVRPAEFEWKGLTLASTRGIWHAFYGQKDRTPMMVRSAISFADGGHSASQQVFDGRFRSSEQRGWSAAILRCIDGVVIFEHPDPMVRLPFSVLREIVGIQGYSPDVSVHRFSDNDNEGVGRQLEEIERMLAFYAE